MEQRIVKLRIADEYIIGAGVSVGAVGSHDEVLLEMDFRPSRLWVGTTRRAIFSNALGKNRTPIILGTNLLAEGQAEVYLVPVPQEAKDVAGECFLTVEGFVTDGNGNEIIRCVTEEVTFRVLPSKLYVNDNDPVTPSQAEQLQAEIDEIKEDIVAAAAASAALEKTLEAQAKSEAARDASQNYASQSSGYMTGARAEAQEAQKQAVLAAGSAQEAQEALEGARTYTQQAADEAERAAALQVQLAKEQADRAQAEAERATVPALEGVYNVIIQDRTNGKRYALLMESGLLCFIQVRSNLDGTEMQIVDQDTGATFVLGVENGALFIEETT